MTVTSACTYNVIDCRVVETHTHTPKVHLKDSFYRLVRLYMYFNITKKEDIRISKSIKIIFEQLKP